jgi:hypothetical protein
MKKNGRQGETDEQRRAECARRENLVIGFRGEPLRLLFPPT